MYLTYSVAWLTSSGIIAVPESDVGNDFLHYRSAKQYKPVERKNPPYKYTDNILLISINWERKQPMRYLTRKNRRCAEPDLLPFSR